MESSNKQSSHFYFLIAFAILNFIAMMLLIASITFLTGFRLTGWHFPLSIVSALIVQYYAASYFFKGEALKTFFLTSGISLAVLGGSLLIGGWFYDVSYDGQAYHQEAIYQLKNGWNPVYEKLPAQVNGSLWINHYAKGAEIPEAVIYRFTNRIETGKGTNIVILFGAFFFCLALLERIPIRSFYTKLFAAAFITLNPVAVSQLLSYYVDGQLVCLLLGLFACCCLLFLEVNRYYLLSFSGLIVTLVNIKFTAVVFAGIFGLGLLLLFLLYKRFKECLLVLGVSLLAGMIAVAVVGYNPFIKNTITEGHPFYPLMTRSGPPAADIMSGNLPTGFFDKSMPEKFLVSFFSHTDNIKAERGRVPELKIPFMVNKTDLVNAPKVDTRIAGFGPWFSGIMLLTVVLALLLAFRHAGELLAAKFGYILAVLLVSVFIIPESWWARYVPQLWFVPPLILVAAYSLKTDRISRALVILIWCTVAVNILFSMTAIAWNIAKTVQIDRQLEELQTSKQVVAVDWGSAESNRIRFMEHHIPFKEQKLSGEKIYAIIRSDSYYQLPGDVKPLPETTILRWTRKLASGTEE